MMDTDSGSFQDYPLLGPLLTYGLGISFVLESGILFFKEWFFVWLWSLLVFLGSLIFLGLLRFPRKAQAALLLLCFILGALRMAQDLPEPLPTFVTEAIAAKQSVPLWVEALEPCQTRQREQGIAQQSFTGRVLAYFQEGQAQAWDTKLRFSLEADQCPVERGDRFRTLARIKTPRRFQNPSAWDYPRFLHLQGISALAYLKGPEWIVPLQASESWTLRLRKHWLRSLEIGLSQFSDPNILGFWEALLLKEKGFLSESLEESFRRLGLSHLMVVSGLHLSLVFGFCFFPIYGVLQFLPRLQAQGGAKKFAALVALVLMGIYATTLGFSASLGRAWWMSAALIWFLFTYRRVKLFSLLLLVAWLLLLWEPGLLYQLSFQLTFAALLALAWFAKRFQAYQKKRKLELRPLSRMQNWFAAALGGTLAVQVLLWPWNVLVFREFSWVAPLTNLIFVPWFSVVLLPLGLLGLVLSLFWSEAAGLVFKCSGYLSEITLGLVEKLAQFPFSVWVQRPPLWSWVLFVAVLGYFFFPQLLKTKKLILCGSLLLGIIFAKELWPSGSKRLKLSMIDVGQGESLLLGLPDQEAVLVDGGGFPASDFEMGAKVLLPELLHRRIGKLKALVLTHPDADHLKGLEFLAEKFPVEACWLPKVFKNDFHVQRFLNACQSRGIPIHFLKQGDQGHWGEVSWQVLWPPAQKRNNDILSDNNQSLVLRMCFQQVCFLLTGDIEAEAEQALVASGVELSAQVLKLAHHGSRTSSTEAFLQAVAPEYALASLGKDHPFGFPHQEVKDRLQKLGIKLFRTDYHGQIEIVTEGEEVWVDLPLTRRN